MPMPLIDLTGQRFGHLIVLDRDGGIWRCRCDCGQVTATSGANLRSGNTRSCGHLKVADNPARQKDLTGQTFGRLTAIEMLPRNGRRGNRWWRCQCACGETKSVRSDRLTSGETISCGCAVAGPFVISRPQEVRDASAQYDRRGIGHIPQHEIDALYERQKGKCPCCLASLADGYHKDHVIPLSRGGAHSIENVQLLCIPCNRRKYNKMPWEFALERGMLV